MNTIMVLAALLMVNTCHSKSTKKIFEDHSTLELVHVLFRHGDRNPDLSNLYPSSLLYAEHFYSPYGYGQLTKKGKMTEYNVGTALRQRYDGFLGQNWNSSLIEMRSTNYDRTKMSAELVLAGLWPPSKRDLWKGNIVWQPIPFTYEQTIEDKELSPFLCCDRLDELMDELLENFGTKLYMESRYNSTMQLLAEKTKIDMTYLNAYQLYFGFFIQSELGLPLEEWVSEVYPQPLHSLLVDYYYLQTNTTQLRRLSSGYLLKKIILDTQNKINGELNPQSRKIFLYSAHEINIASLLLSLDVYKIADVPAYGSYVVLEVHNIDGVHGIKIFYQDNKEAELHGPLNIPSCGEFCPFEEFVSLTAKLLPANALECYGSPKPSQLRSKGAKIRGLW